MVTDTKGFTITSKHLLTVVSDRAKPFANLLRGRPVLVTFQVTLRCNSACGYCDLPLNQGRYELSREEIRSIFGNLHAEGIRFVLLQVESRSCVSTCSTCWRISLSLDCT